MREHERMEKPPPRLFRWQALTVVLMVIGYAGYYLCRSDYSVALPLIIQELAARGISPADARDRLGAIASISVLAYAISKFFSGSLTDFLGGRRSFLTGMVGSVCFTIMFALGGGIPVWKDNEVIGAIAVSGLPEAEDIELATYGAQALPDTPVTRA